jgi:hypothetical protein
MTNIYVHINESNVVTNAAIFDDDNPPTEPGWIQREASQGQTYVPESDIFYGPATYAGWVLDEEFIWQPPADKPYPEGWPGPPSTWSWDDNAQQWVEIEISEA